MKFKVGDPVRVKKWEMMAEEFGVGKYGEIAVGDTFFTKQMKKLCGKPAVVLEVGKKFYKLRPMQVEDLKLDWKWDFSDEMLTEL